MNLREYVHAAIVRFSQQSFSIIESGTTFLKSDDPVAVRVRQVLGFRSIPEVVAQLEEIYRTCPEDEWRYAGGEVLAGSVQTVRGERNGAEMARDCYIEIPPEEHGQRRFPGCSCCKNWINRCYNRDFMQYKQVKLRGGTVK